MALMWSSANAPTTRRQWFSNAVPGYPASMRISDILLPRAVVVPLSADSREEAIRQLARALPLPSDGQQEVELSALARERAGSTGIGEGLALPHGSCRKLTSPMLAFGRMSAPIDFCAPDGILVDLVFLLAVPQEKFYCHLYPLSMLSQLPACTELLDQLRSAESAAEMFQLVAALPI